MKEFLIILIILLKILFLILTVFLLFVSNIKSAKRKGYDGRNAFKALDFRGAMEVIAIGAGWVTISILLNKIL